MDDSPFSLRQDRSRASEDIISDASLMTGPQKHSAGGSGVHEQILAANPDAPEERREAIIKNGTRLAASLKEESLGLAARRVVNQGGSKPGAAVTERPFPHGRPADERVYEMGLQNPQIFAVEGLRFAAEERRRST